MPADGEPLIDLSAPVRPGDRRSPGVIVAGAVAVFIAGGVGFAALRPSPPEVAPARPGVTAEVSAPPAPLVGRAGIPEGAGDPGRRSPATR
ncbi:hypothetical protein Abr02nite_22000 [Paractinoplanes brasiliensis]|nr:hypothetical protein Abr02nite_22000 [Actinoplanes brasiliensis]